MTGKPTPRMPVEPDPSQLQPDDAEAYHNRGLIYEKQGQKTLAQADFAQAKQREALTRSAK